MDTVDDLTPDLATVGVITALPEEYAAAREVLECGPEKPNTLGRKQGAGRSYALSRISARGGGHNVVAVAFQADMGNNSASVRATRMLEHCPNVSLIIMTGIAGAVPCPSKPAEHVRLGDIVVSDAGGVIQYDFDKESLLGTDVRSRPRPPAAELIEAVAFLMVDLALGRRPWEHHVRDFQDRYGSDWTRPPDDTDILMEWDPQRRVLSLIGLLLAKCGIVWAPSIAHPPDPDGINNGTRVHRGPIASANKVLKNPRKRELLRRRYGVRAVEMEGSGIADASWTMGTGYLVIRGAADYCNQGKNDRWHNYAALAAAAFTRCVIETLPPYTPSGSSQAERGLVTAGSGGGSASPLAGAGDIRAVEMKATVDSLTSHRVPAKVLWITGSPGIGKTWFALHLAKKLSSGQEPMYLERGACDNIPQLVAAVKRDLPRQWFAVVNARGEPSPDLLDERAQLALALDALLLSGQCTVIEDGHRFTDSQHSSPLTDVIERVSGLSRSPSAIVTSYSFPQGLPETHIEAHLDGLSLDDTKTLIKLFCNVPDAVCKKVWERYHGHTLSVTAWAKDRALSQDAASTEEGATGLPADTTSRFQAAWNRLSPEVQGLFGAISDFPDFAIPGIVPIPATEALLSVGLMSRYPVSRSSGVAYYIHPLAREACYGLLPGAVRQDAAITLLNSAISHGMMTAELQLIGPLIEASRIMQAAQLLSDAGREWLETCGIAKTEAVTRQLRTHLTPGSRESFFSHYLDVIGALFAGEYDVCMSRIVAAAGEIAALPSSCHDALLAERMECLRRLGRVDEVVPIFNALLKGATEDGEAEDAYAAHFSGVVAFIVGHVLRSLLQHDEAYTWYDKSEKMHRRVGTRGSYIEVLHCVYAKSICLGPTARGLSPEAVSSLRTGTQSGFLHGLLWLAECQSHVGAGAYEKATEAAGQARECFEDFGSVVYYQRAVCLEGMVRILTGDAAGASEAVAGVLGPRAATSGIRLVSSTISKITRGNHDSAWEAVSSNVPELLRTGRTSSVLSLVAFLQKATGRVPNVQAQYAVPVFDKSASGEWQLASVSLRSLPALHDWLCHRLRLKPGDLPIMSVT